MKKTNLLIFLLIYCLSLQSYAQSPYSVSFKKDAGVLMSGIGIFFTGLYFHNFIDPLTLDEINNLSKQDINSFDRIAASNWSPQAHRYSNVLLVSFKLLPLPFLLSKFIRNDFITLAVMYAEMEIFVNGFKYISKGMVQRIRPYVYNSDSDIPAEQKTEKDAKRSFYSGHTTAAFASAVFASTVFSDYFPHSKWKSVMWGSTLLGASATAYFRVAAGKHFPTDVLAGAFMGSLVGYLVPEFHRVEKKESQFSIVPVYNYITVSYEF